MRATSKWIGETEKNLSAILAAAEHADVLLFFDETDVLFAARTDTARWLPLPHLHPSRARGGLILCWVADHILGRTRGWRHGWPPFDAASNS